jgi:hypothetical protein
MNYIVIFDQNTATPTLLAEADGKPAAFPTYEKAKSAGELGLYNEDAKTFGVFVECTE